jgi:hypothetical protein
MIIEETSPMLTCVKANDGYLYELAIKNSRHKAPIDKLRIGPYHFKPAFKPRNGFLGFPAGGPENAFWMHKRAPSKWSRFHWEVDAFDSAAYLVIDGLLAPGETGEFQFLSLYPPGGLRAGLEIYRGSDHVDYGVTGPNYEEFLEEEH